MSGLREKAMHWAAFEEAQGVPPAQRTFLVEPKRSTAPAVLLVHGGGGSPEDMAGLAADLARGGRIAFAPLLPAHGLGDEALEAIRFEALVGRALEAFDLLTAEAGVPPTLVGLSLGGVLGIRIATRRQPAAFVALAPALRPFVVRRAVSLAGEALVRPRAALVRYRWQREVWRGIQATEPEIPRVEAPLLVMHSRDDASVSRRGARLLHDGASSSSKRLHLVDRQGHVLSQAPEPEVVFGPIRAFLDEHSPPNEVSSRERRT